MCTLAMQWAVGQAANDLNCCLLLTKSNLELLMSLDKSDVEKIAHLARLSIDESAIPDYARDLNKILNLVEEMSAIDTSNISPMAHPLDAQQRLRPDAVTESDQRELFQSIAPETDAGVYLVPKVID
jgi:aspartyl-tRNA(Asn)/glutamyl-tRNA(Gln) amidotransferase subunit C